MSRWKDQQRVLLRLVELSAQHIADAEQMLATTVGEARAAGATWQQIGDALGIKGEAAAKRYRPGRDQ